jgi:hypothetical protein
MLGRAVRRRATSSVETREEHEWSPGEQPWIRRQVPVSNVALPPGAQSTTASAGPCYFCGDSTVIRSWGDIEEDTGRLELYCDNQACSARSFTVLVRIDGVSAANRADNRVLNWLDRGGVPEPTAHSTGLITRKVGRNSSDEEVVARRVSTDVIDIIVP